MALFSRKRPDPPALHPWPGPPSKPAYVDRLQRGDIAGAVALLGSLPGDERFALLWGASDAARYDDVAELVEARPDDSQTQVLAAVSAMKTAWEVRTGARATEVSRAQFAGFHSWLDGAQEHALTATELDPADAAPWVVLVTAGRGLQVGLEEILRRFEEGRRREPQHPELHRQMLQGICAKWSGSNEQMFAWAHAVSAAEPVGSPLHEVLVSAHIEGFLDADESKRYWSRADVRADVQTARERLALTGAPTSRDVLARNLLALTSWKALDRTAFVADVEQMQGVVTDWPWEMWRRSGTSADIVRIAWNQVHA